MREFMGVNKSLDEDFNALGIKLSESRYEIFNKQSGESLGKYDGKNELDAYQSMLKDAGYSKKKLAPGQKKWDEIPSDIEIKDLSESKFMGEGGFDKDAVRELELYMDDDKDIYNKKVNIYWKDLVSKIVQGKYNSKSAINVLSGLVKDAAKSYIKEFGGGKWNEIFDKGVVEEIAKWLKAEFEEVIKTGEYDKEFRKFVPKKYSGIDLKKSLEQGGPVMEEWKRIKRNNRNKRNGGIIREAIIVKSGEKVLVESKSKGKLTEGEEDFDELYNWIINDEGLYRQLEDVRKDVLDGIVDGMVLDKRDFEDPFIELALNAVGVIPSGGFNFSRTTATDVGEELASAFYDELKSRRHNRHYLSNYDDEEVRDIRSFLKKLRY